MHIPLFTQEKTRPSAVRIAFVFVFILVLAVPAPAAVGAAVRSRSTARPAPAAGYPAALKRFYTQKLKWTRCTPGSTVLCAIMVVPRDYASPTKYGTFRIQVARQPATGTRSQHKGAIFTNPGGPGSSGLGSLLMGNVADTSANGLSLTKSYDLVSFDPRGVGDSTPIYCLTGRQLDGLNFTDESPTNAEQQATLVRNFSLIGSACKRRAPTEYRWLNTAQTARDVDVLRALLGQPTFNWYGFSYGTLLGATYAELFPRRVGRMVLDGVVPTDLTFLRESIDDASLQELGIRHYFATCASRDGCPFKSDPAGGEAKLVALEASLRSHPIKVATSKGSGTVNDVVLRSEILSSVSAEGHYAALDKLLAPLVLGGDAAPLYEDYYSGLELSSGGRWTKSVNQFYSSHFAIKCSDSPVTASIATIAAAATRGARVNPLTGAGAVWSAAQCLNWPREARTKMLPSRFKDRGLPPIVLVGSSHDTTTPLSWAAHEAGQIKGSSLIEADNWSHTSSQSVPCVQNAVYRYLLTGKTPGRRVACVGSSKTLTTRQVERKR